MSIFRFQQLERHRVGGTREQMELAIPPPRSPSGKVHRCCPVAECTPNLFQLGDAPAGQSISGDHTTLVRRAPGTPGVTCPYCGQDAADDEFIFRGDIDAAEEYILWALKEDVGDSVERWASDLNRSLRRSGGGLVSMSVDVKRPQNTRPFVWREDLLRDLTCDICGRRYGVYAVALFCPDCGARNIHVHFRRELELVGQQIALAQQVGLDGNQELAYRLLGNAHEDVLTAFETYLKVLYRFLVKRRLPQEADVLCSKGAIGNRFQNIRRGRELFSKLVLDPYADLTTADLEFLRLNIEKRHVVGHNLSMVDEAYAEAAQGQQPGQTVQLLAEEITCFAEVCRAVVTRLEEDCEEFQPSLAAGSP